MTNRVLAIAAFALLALAVLAMQPAHATQNQRHNNVYDCDNLTQTAPAGATCGDSVSSSSNSSTSSGAGATSNVSGDTSNDRSLSFTAAPVHAAVPGSLNVCALSNSTAVGVGWNFLSWATAKQTLASLCIYEQQARVAFETCQFRTASALRYAIVRNAGKASVLLTSESNPYANGEEYDPWAITKEREQDTSVGGILESAGVDRPWEQQRNYPVEECEAIKTRTVQGPRGEAGPAGPKGDRGPRGYRGKAKLVPAIPVATCNTCTGGK